MKTEVVMKDHVNFLVIDGVNRAVVNLAYTANRKESFWTLAPSEGLKYSALVQKSLKEIYSALSLINSVDN